MGGVFGGGNSYTPPEPEELPMDLSEEKAREDRLEMIRHRRRGRVGTIHTSWTGDKVDIPDELSLSHGVGDSETDVKTFKSGAKSVNQLKSTLGG